MTEKEAITVLSDFFHGRRNSCGDYWGVHAVKAAIECLLGRKLELNP